MRSISAWSSAAGPQAARALNRVGDRDAPFVQGAPPSKSLAIGDIVDQRIPERARRPGRLGRRCRMLVRNCFSIDRTRALPRRRAASMSVDFETTA